MREANDFMARFLSSEHSLIFLAALDKDDLTLPSTDEISNVLTQRMPLFKRSQVAQQPEASLMEEVPQPADVVKEEWDPRLDLHVLTYVNGVKALLKHNPTEENQAVFDLADQGGRSRVRNDSFYSAFLVADTAYKSGVGHLDGDRTDRFLDHTSIYFEPYLSEAAEGYYGETDVSELETLFQLVHLFQTQPRFDEGSFQEVLDDRRTELRNQNLDPHFVLLDHVTALKYPKSPRLRPMLLADLAEVDFVRAQDIHAERFTAMNVPTLALVGDFELAEARRLISTYIGTLTFTGEAETWQDRSVANEPGPLQNYIHHGQGSQVLVEQTYGHNRVSDLDRADEVALRALSRILHSRLEYQLREELGGTYHVEVYVWLQPGPHAGANLVIRFATNERQVENLMQTSRTVMQEILTQGVMSRELVAAKEQLLADLKADRNSNYYWVNAIFHEFVYGTGNLDKIDGDEAHINSLTLQQINALAPVVLNVDRLVEVALIPGNQVPESLPD